MNEEQETGANAPRVLVVDDDDSIRALVARIFLRRGFAVETASDGVEAIAALDAAHYDLLLLDLMMPRVDGIGVIEHLSKRHGERPRVVMMTAAVPDILRRMDRSQVASVITKPFELSDLLAAGEQALAQPS
ncbi:MAG TPA: response regulator [Thermoanaerobaculia bacterium]|nr:response regulator [Thermoanaerobaculia bacterium]